MTKTMKQLLSELYGPNAPGVSGFPAHGTMVVVTDKRRLKAARELENLKLVTLRPVGPVDMAGKPVLYHIQTRFKQAPANKFHQEGDE